MGGARRGSCAPFVLPCPMYSKACSPRLLTSVTRHENVLHSRPTLLEGMTRLGIDLLRLHSLLTGEMGHLLLPVHFSGIRMAHGQRYIPRWNKTVTSWYCSGSHCQCMDRKAKLFGEDETWLLYILDATDPCEEESLGRSVQGFHHAM